MESKMPLCGLELSKRDEGFFVEWNVWFSRQSNPATFSVNKAGPRWNYVARLYAGGYTTLYTSGPGYDTDRLALRGLRRWLKPLVELADVAEPLVEITKSGKQFGWKVKWAEGCNREQEVETVYTKRSSAERAADKYVEALREMAGAEAASHIAFDGMGQAGTGDAVRSVVQTVEYELQRGGLPPVKVEVE